MKEIRNILLSPEEADGWFQLLDDLEAMVEDGALEIDTNGGYKVTPKGHALAAVAERKSA